MVSRNEGYRRGAGKEEVAIEILQAFLKERIGNPGSVIEDPAENYLFGDLRFGDGPTIECKGQPIDPAKYRQNFVEVFEVTGNQRHSGGFSSLCSVLGFSPDVLAATKVRVAGTTTEVGRLPYVSVSVTSISSAAFTAYVNYLDGGKHIYVYARDEILGHVRSALANGGFVRGAGKSNEDTFAVFIPLSGMRWSREDGKWSVSGEVTEAKAVATLSAALLG